MDNKIKIKFCTGVGTVTGANFLVETGKGSQILIDCGLIQGEKFAQDENNEPFLFKPSEIQVLCVTHAHLDHVGRIPVLVKQGFKGIIYSTPETRALAELVLADAVGIMNSEAKHEGVEPLYNLNDVQNVFPLWKTISYHEETKICDDISIFLKDAGHILGSSMVEVRVHTEDESIKTINTLKVLFTGDLGNSPAPLLRDTEAVGEVDYLVMESVYGDHNHESRDDRTNKFKEIILETIARGGTLVIPAFSIDRTQVLLYELNNMVEKKLIPSVPVFVDSPMAIKATQIYAENSNLFNDQVQTQIKSGDDIFKFPHLEYTMSQGESRDIEKMKGAKIILAGSGMSVGGRVISHEEHYLPDPKNTILLVGYQSLGSIGRQLADGQKKITIHGRAIEVNAEIAELYGYSAHKDSDHLVEFVSTATDSLKEVFSVMGEPKASMHLAQRINDEIGVKAIVPERGQDYFLE